MRRLVVIKMVLVICLMASLPLIKVEAKSSIYAELLGSGILYSLNYEYFIKDDLPIRIGFEYFSWENDRKTAVTKEIMTGFPIILSKLIGEGKHKLELGGGALLATWKEEGSTIIFSPDGVGISPIKDSGTRFDLLGVVGYRFQAPEKGFLFRLSYTPLIATTGENGLLWFGLSLGVTF